MTLQQLAYFVAAVEHGSFSAAADALYIAQPSLSEQIRRLENELGVALFVRTNRRLILTEAAQLLLPHAQRTLAAAREAAAAGQVRRAMSVKACIAMFRQMMFASGSGMHRVLCTRQRFCRRLIMAAHLAASPFHLDRITRWLPIPTPARFCL